jgi:hypothetical protein
MKRSFEEVEEIVIGEDDSVSSVTVKKQKMSGILIDLHTGEEVEYSIYPSDMPPLEDHDPEDLKPPISIQYMLTDEIWSKILQMLSIFDLNSLRRVCTKFYQLINNKGTEVTIQEYIKQKRTSIDQEYVKELQLVSVNGVGPRSREERWTISISDLLGPRLIFTPIKPGYWSGQKNEVTNLNSFWNNYSIGKWKPAPTSTYDKLRSIVFKHGDSEQNLLSLFL